MHLREESGELQVLVDAALENEVDEGPCAAYVRGRRSGPRASHRVLDPGRRAEAVGGPGRILDRRAGDLRDAGRLLDCSRD
jgi:hypothetical protein